MELKMGLTPKLHLLKSHYSTKPDLFDINPGSCSHMCIAPFWVLLSYENPKLAVIQGWCWPEECGRFHRWASPSHSCSSQQWWLSGAWSRSGPTARSHRCWDAEGGIYQQMSLVEHWEVGHTPQPVPNTSYRPGQLLVVQGAHTDTQGKTPGALGFLSLLFLFIALPAILGRESFQPVQKMRQQFPPLKHFLWLFWGRKWLQESRFSFLCSVYILLFLLWKQSLHSAKVFWVSDAQCRLLSTSTSVPRGVCPAESGVCWKIYPPAV